MTKSSMIILYVSDQEQSKHFYRTVLNSDPVLDVPGMTEFKLAEGFLLGLMPENGIAKILTPATAHPKDGNGIPRCELYLIADDPHASLQRAANAGAKLISPAQARDWGDTVGYCADRDGHVIAFAG